MQGNGAALSGRVKITCRCCLAALFLLPGCFAQSQHAARASECAPQHNFSYVDRNGTAHVTRVVPVPSTVSPEARKLIGSDFANVPCGNSSKPHAQIDPAQALASERSRADATEARLGKEALATFPAIVSKGTIAGVPVRVIEPKAPDAEKADKVLINIHGGGFVADWGSLTETIPIASLTHIKVISVLYRMAPEHPYPAAVDDVVAVYRELLKAYKPGNMGMYGTSAGAILTAETASRLRQLGLPLPGALGIFSGSGDLSHRGDSESLFSVTGLAGPLEPQAGPPFAEYVGTANRHDPVVSPIYANLHGFPPTLFLSSTRDLLLSDTAMLERAFLKAGVPSQFVVFEALQHGFWNDPGLPESREADRTIADFFATHLGTRMVGEYSSRTQRSTRVQPSR